MKLIIRPTTEEDKDWVKEFTFANWGTDAKMTRGKIHYPYELPGYISEVGSNKVGLITYRVSDTATEIITLNSWWESRGIGTALITAVKKEARDNSSKRLFVLANNDHINALRFYQKRGFRLVKIHRDAITKARKIKPEIPSDGDHGIKICDEIELELILN